MRVLLDTCVISEISRAKGATRVKERVGAMRSEDMFLSVITLGEIARGIALLAAGRKKNDLERFLLRLEQDHGGRILDIDVETARIWGESAAEAQSRGHVVPACDGLIAATAVRHGLCVVTRNVRHFAEAGARVLDPWNEA